MDKEKILNNFEKVNKILKNINKIIFLIYIFIPISLLLESILWELLIKRLGLCNHLLETIVQFPSEFIYRYLISGYPYDNQPLFPFIFVFQFMLLVVEIITGLILKKNVLVSVFIFAIDMIIFGVVVFMLAIAAGLSI